MVVIRWVAILISVASFVFAIIAFNLSRKADRSRARQQYNAELRSWANSGIANFSNATGVLRNSIFCKDRVIEIASHFSALADQGRLFFPNKRYGLWGQENEEAFRDFRPRILDWLVYGHRICISVSELPDKDAGEAMFLLQRGFTSDAQLAIDPRNLSMTIEEFQDLLDKEPPFMDVSQQHSNLLAAERYLTSLSRSNC